MICSSLKRLLFIVCLLVGKQANSKHRTFQGSRSSGQRLAADTSLIEADANKQNSTPKEDWDRNAIDPNDAPREVKEYLDVLDDAAFGAASEVEPKFTSHSDPASQWTAARKGPAFFSYSTNCLIDTDHSVIVDVEGTRSIRQAEVGSVRTMLDRIKDRHDIDPERLIADTAYGTGPMLGGLVKRGIAPHIPVIDQAKKHKTFGHVMTLNGIKKMIDTFAQKGTTTSSSGAIILIQIVAHRAKVQCDIVL